jgi:hypothetical protein
MLGAEHLQFRTLTIDGELKAAVKVVKKWGFIGMKIKNVAALMGTLDDQDVVITLIATPESHTLFAVAVMYEGTKQWDAQLSHYQSINAALAAQYGEPVQLISEWESPYSLENNPLQAFKEDKATYGQLYAAPGGKVAVNMMYLDEKLCTIVTYVDELNVLLYKQEGGTETLLDDFDEPDDIIE